MSDEGSIDQDLQKVMQHIEGGKGQEALDVLEALFDQHYAELNYRQKHACHYTRVCAVAFVAGPTQFQRALDNYNDEYLDFFRQARCYNHLTKSYFPTYLKEIVEEYTKAKDALWIPISHFAMNMTGGADNVADVFNNRYYTDSPEAFQRAQSRREALGIVYSEATDSVGKRRLFKALSTAGFLIASLGTLTEGNSNVNSKQVMSGIELLEGAAKIAEEKEVGISPLLLTRNLFDQGMLFQCIDNKEKSAELFKQVLTLLDEDERNKTTPPTDVIDLNQTTSLAELPDPLYQLATDALARVS